MPKPRFTIVHLVFVLALLGHACERRWPKPAGPCVRVDPQADEAFERNAKSRRTFEREQSERGYPEGAYALVFYSQQESALWAFVRDDSWVGVLRGGNFLVSFDQGQTWKQEDRGLSGLATSVFAMAEDKSHGLVYLANHQGIYRKQAGRAQAWQRIDPENSTERSGPWVVQLEIDETRGDLYGRMVNDGHGIHKLAFGESSWQSLGEKLPKEWSTADIAFSAKTRELFIVHDERDVLVLHRTPLPKPAVLKASVDRASFDWQPVTTPCAPSEHRSLVDISSDSVTGEVYGGGYGAFYRWAETGCWQPVFRSTVTWASFEPGGQSRALALNPESLWLRVGSAWHQLNPAWDQGASVWSVAFVEQALFIGTNAGLFVSGDNGASWERRPSRAKATASKVQSP